MRFLLDGLERLVERPRLRLAVAPRLDDKDDDEEEAAPAPVERPRARRQAQSRHPVALVVDESLPSELQAVSLALGVLREAGVRRWADFGSEWPSSVFVAEEQLELLRRHADLLGLVSWSGGGEKNVTLAMCPKCRRWELTTGSIWSSCNMTLGCGGKPIKAQPAKRLRTTPSREAA